MVHMYHYQDVKLNSTWHNPLLLHSNIFPACSLRTVCLGVWLAIASLDFVRLTLPLCSHVCILFLSQSLMFTSLLFLLLRFIYATDVPSPEDVKLAALCNPLGFPGYGIYRFTFLSCIYSSIVMI